MKYSDVLRDCRKAENLTEAVEDEMPELSEMPEEEMETPEDAVEPSEIELGSMCKVIDADALTAADLGLSDEDYEEFKAKVEEECYCIVYDINDDDDTLVNIVFEDGMEVENVPKINLQTIEDED